MQDLIRQLHEGGYSCVVRQGAEVRTFTRRGVADLYDLLCNDPDFLRGASVADKVIGKGAAALLILGGVRQLHADIISVGALELLRDQPIEVAWDTLSPHIENRDRTGRCPLDSTCAEARTAEECLPLIRDFIGRMRRQAAKAVGVVALLLACFGTARGAEADTLRREAVHPIDEVVVTGSRQAVDPRLLPMTVSTLSRPQIEQAGRASLLPTLTEQIPGLFITARGQMGYGVSTGAAGGMSMRGIGGSPTTGLVVLIDGQPQYMGLMGHPIADACQSMLAERVEVVRGPASVLYGTNAAGGVINIVTRKMTQEGVRADLHAAGGSYGTFESEAALRFRKGRLTGVATGSYNRTDGHRPDMGFAQYGGFAKLGCRLTQAWEATADLNIIRFDASNPGPVSAPILDNDARVTRGRGSVALHNDYGHTSGAVTFFYNWGLHRIDDGYTPGSEPLDYRFRSRDRMLGLSLHQTIRLFRGNRLTVGFDYQQFGGAARNVYLNGDPDKLLADKKMHETAGYVDFRQALTGRLTLDLGLRLDRHSHAGTEWVPQGGLSWQFSDKMRLKAIVSKGFRFPTIREMYMFPPQNPDLKAERLMNYELSLARQPRSGRFAWAVNLYVIDGENMIVLLPVDGRNKYVNTGRVRNWGVEGEFSHRLGSAVTLRANYSYLHMKYPLVAAPEHKLYCGIDFAKGRWSGSSGMQYVHGLYTQLDPARREHMALWNARLNCRVARRIELFVRGENLLAQRYEINAGYPMPRATVLGGLNVHL